MALAHGARDPNVGQKVHLELVRAVALARLAAAAADVEAEPPRLVSPRLRLGQLRVKPADFVEDLDVRGGIGPRRAPDRRLVDGDHLVEVLQAVDPPVVAGIAEAAVQVAPQGLDENVVDQRALARAGDAGHADEHAQRNLDVDFLEVVVPRAADDEFGVADGPAAGRGSRSAACRKRYWPGDALRLGDDFGCRTRGDDVPAVDARPGAEIDDVIGRQHRVLVVLDDDHGVAQVAEPPERVQQAVVVAGMQADRRLVEDVQHADQPAADLARQPDALHLAAGKRRGGAVQVEIFQADVFQELQPAANFLEHVLGDLLAGGIKLQFAEILFGSGDGQRADLGQGAFGPVAERRIAAGDGDGPGLRIQPLAPAAAAAEDAHVFFQLAALEPALGGAILGEELGDDSLELAAPLVARGSAAPGEGDVLVAGAPEQGVLQLGIELFPSGFQDRARVKAVLPFEHFGHAAVDMPPPPAHVAPRTDQFDAALLKRPAGVGNQPLGIECVDLPQPARTRGTSLRTVETEHLRAGRLEAQVAMRAGIVGGERGERGEGRGGEERGREGEGGAGSLIIWGFGDLKIGRFRKNFGSSLSSSPLSPVFCLPPSPLSSLPSSATTRFPSPSRRANSTASASRGRTFGPATSRSITTSMLCRI